MSARIVPCDSCGSPIPDADLETGQAVTLLGKRYCGGCKADAIRNVSLEDLSGARPAAPAAPAKKTPVVPKPAAARSQAAKAAPAPVSVERKASARRTPTSVAAPSRTPLVAGIAGAAVLLVAGAAYLGFHEPPSRSPVPIKGAPPTSPGSAVNSSPEERARVAFLQVQELSTRSGTSWDLVLAAGEKARPTCRGSSFEKSLEALLAKVQREKESEEAARELSPLIDELKGAVATDSEFKRYSELQPKFRLAIETAAKSGSPRVNEIRALQSEYNLRYEKLAEPYYNEIHEAAVALTDERRYDDAIRKIDTFPQQFRNSGTWTTLEKLRQDIERRKKK